MSLPRSTPPLSDAERIGQLEEQLKQRKQQLQWAELKIRALEERLRLQLITKYGPASEKLSDAQLELLELEPGISNVEVQAESDREPPPKHPASAGTASIRAGSNCPPICHARRAPTVKRTALHLREDDASPRQGAIT